MNTKDARLAGLLALFYVALFGTLGVQLPFLPRWLEARGIEGLRMGLVAALVPGMALIGPPLFGLAADAFGLRGWLLRGAALMSFLCFALIGGAAAAGQPLEYAALLGAVGVFAFFRSSMVMMADVMTMEHARKTGRSYPRIRLWGSVGFLVAALAAGRWMDPRDPATLPLLIASGFFVAFLVTWVLPARAETPPSASLANARRLLRATDFRLFLGACLLSQLAHASYDLCFSLHLRDLGADGSFTGAAWSLGVVTEIVLMAFAPGVFSRFSPRRLIVFALGAAAVRWICIASIRSLPILLALQPLHALSFALVWIAALAYVRERAPLQALATAQGLLSASTALGLVCGTLLWSGVYRAAGGGTTFALASMVSLAGLVVATAWSRSCDLELGVAVKLANRSA